jgi:UDP-glucuronate 4-epimerase
MKVLVTGAAGFIGMHAARRLLERGDEVTGIDNLDSYYDLSIKEARLEQLRPRPGFRFQKMDIVDAEAMAALFSEGSFDAVIHLAAQAGVRYSLRNPAAYVQSNVVGFLNVLEGCRNAKIGHLVYASSSSVYGGNTELPYSERQNVDQPISMYAATKKADELMAHCYSHLYGLPTTGLRFFTVYGPWGRPDMALFIFTKAILENRPIQVFNHGRMQRDFTYIDDIVEGVVRVLDRPATREPATPAPYRIFNIGNHAAVDLMRFIELLEEKLGRKAQKEFLPMQQGDVPATFADIDALAAWSGFAPRTPVEEGIGRFVEWYRSYYKV